MKQLCFSFLLLIVSFSFAQVKKVDAITITVDDMDRSVKFYSEVLDFKKVSDVELNGEYWEKLFGVFGLNIRIVRMELGDEAIELIDYLTAGGRSIPEDFKSNDLTFQHIAIVVSDMDSAYKILRRANVVHVSTSPQTLPASIPAAAGISAFYFQDPDKHVLELIFFPKGKGQPKWHQRSDKIFLGIDHTAIAVSNTERSHKFYSEILGFDRKGDSWNKGNEQSHLNNVEGASLHITGYRSAFGAGVEFLEYLYPGPGRTYPVDTKSNDLWNWITVIHVSNSKKIYQELRTRGYRFVSNGLLEEKQPGKVATISFIVRDPDGHAVHIKEQIK
jgi:catechol 2,3-dioxygenase-like lactoylglutathione lyase family enzyme